VGVQLQLRTSILNFGKKGLAAQVGALAKYDYAALKN
jgi:hypothetical protein